MKILSKGNKDYYDYLMGVYGQDDLIVYDRRECYPIDPTKKWGDDIDRAVPCNTSNIMNLNIEKWFRKEVMCFDKPRQEIKMYSTKKFNVGKKYREEDKHRKNGIAVKVMEGDVYHFILEVGFRHYVFEVERYIDDKDPNKLNLEYDMIMSYEVPQDKRVGHTPITLIPLNRIYHYWLTSNEYLRITEEDKAQAIYNPILYSTYIPKFISADEVWRLVYEYISSLKNVDIVDTRTNEQHIESHGFDKKISFRHRK